MTDEARPRPNAMVKRNQAAWEEFHAHTAPYLVSVREYFDWGWDLALEDTLPLYERVAETASKLIDAIDEGDTGPLSAGELARFVLWAELPDALDALKEARDAETEVK